MSACEHPSADETVTCPPSPSWALAGHCVHCTKPVYGPHAEADPATHPCCAWWAAQGYARCHACRPTGSRGPARPTPAREAARVPASPPPAPSDGSQHPTGPSRAIQRPVAQVNPPRLGDRP